MSEALLVETLPLPPFNLDVNAPGYDRAGDGVPLRGGVSLLLHNGKPRVTSVNGNRRCLKYYEAAKPAAHPRAPGVKVHANVRKPFKGGRP